jgi:hypothetical protein
VTVPEGRCLPGVLTPLLGVHSPARWAIRYSPGNLPGSRVLFARQRALSPFDSGAARFLFAGAAWSANQKEDWLSVRVAQHANRWLSLAPAEGKNTRCVLGKRGVLVKLGACGAGAFDLDEFRVIGVVGCAVGGGANLPQAGW